MVKGKDTIVVIPYVKDDGIQLRYTLRSIHRYFKGCEVIICGDAPEWFTGAVIPRANKRRTPKLDIELNICAGLEALQSMGHRQAVIWHDDIIALNTIEIFNDEYEGTLRELSWKKSKKSEWYKQTEQLLQTNKLPARAYTLHTPHRVDVDKYLYVSKTVVSPLLFAGKKILARSVYENMYNHSPRKGKDYQITDVDTPINMYNLYVSVRHSKSRAMKQIKRLLPKKCKWEK